MHHFGFLVPSTNTIVEIEYGRLLPPNLQVHVARIPFLSRGSDDSDVDYQTRLLGSAKVEVVALAQTGVTLSADDYDEQITKRISEAAGVPAITSARAIGLAVRALGARRIALVSPYPIPVLERATRHYTDKYGLEVVAFESFSGAESTIYPMLGPDEARDAIARTDRPEIEVFVVPAGNLPTMSFIPHWERAVGKPVISTNQAALWAMIQIMGVEEKLPGMGRLLEEMPAM